MATTNNEAVIKKNNSGRYSVRIGNKKYNDMSYEDAQRRAKGNYQTRPDSETDSPAQKRRNLALGIKPGDSDAKRDTALSGVIGLNDLKQPTVAPTLPNPPKARDMSSTIIGNNVALGSDPTGTFQIQQPTVEQPTPGQSIIQNFEQKYGLKQPDAPESRLDLWKDAMREFDIRDKQRDVTKYQNNLNAIVAKSQADQLAVTGQGRGIPEVIIGGQQAQIAKEAAIQALPIQAQLAAAQGDLEMAKQNMDTYLTLASKDIEDKFNYDMKLYEVGRELAMNEDKKLFDEKMANRDFERQKEIAKINFNYDYQLKQMGLAADFQKDIIAQTASQQKAQSAALGGYQLVDEVLNSGQVENVFGINKWNPFNYIPGKKVQYAKNQVNQIRSMLSLDNREKLKGSGAISDFEAKMLSQAASSLGSNLSNADAIRELKKVRGAFANAAGQPALVKITDPSTGRSITTAATRDTINQALIDGAKVEYQ